ncbi:MAG: KH domain-containing protein [Candidatus Levybacteria bacterium]|nr:KH domain-containing protein [Candidatus Levybacteria bacterium]
MSKSKTTKRKPKTVEDLIKEFFKSLGIDTSFTLEETDEEIRLTLETEDSGMIIGYHGETLDALQLILSLILAKKQGSFKRVSIEVGDYKKNREEWLRRLAADAKEKAVSQQREIRLEELKAWERRIVHMVLAEDDQVVSESMGEGRERVLVVRPK